MSDEEEAKKAFRKFRNLAKRVISVSKEEIDKRAKEWKETRESDKTETAAE
jgi:hypothetical protein